MKRFTALSLCFFLLFSVLSGNPGALRAVEAKNDNNYESTGEINTDSESVSEAVYGEQNVQKNKYIIGFKENVKNQISTFSTDMNSFGLNQIEDLEYLTPNMAVGLLDAEQIEQLENNHLIEFIEEDAPITILSNESQSSDLSAGQVIPWGFQMIGADVTSATYGLGDGIKIAVMDTGIADHPDLFIDGGVSFVDGVNNYDDDHGHGTHVAGIVGARNNDIGIIGAASQAKIYAVKVMDSTGTGTYSQVIQGIEWAINHDIDVINMSFGGTEYSQALHNAINRAYEHGILMVAPAGNSDSEQLHYPANFPEVVSAGSINRSLEKSSFSNTDENLDFVAPGTRILSTALDSKYGVASGTSMASAYVAGSLASLWSINKEWTGTEVVERLYQSAIPLNSEFEYGKGLIHLANAAGLTNLEVPPEVYGDGSEHWELLEWSASDSGDISISSYDKVGDGQTIQAGEVAMVSLKLDGNPDGSNPHEVIEISVFPAGNESQILDYQVVNNPELNESIVYSWHTDESTPPGHYIIEYHYPATPDYDDIFHIYVEASDTEPPIVEISLDSDNTYVVDNWINLQFFASDNEGIDELTLKVDLDGTNLYDSLDVTGLTNFELYVRDAGHYKVTIFAKDHSGNTSSDDVEFDIDIRRDVVLYVPGFLGTEIWRPTTTGGFRRIWPTLIPLDVYTLALTENGDPGFTFIGDVFEEFVIVDNGKTLINALENEGVQVIKVPYDFRRDLNIAAETNIADAVEQALDESNGQDITIISHSTGALPVKKYLLDNPDAKVKNWINLAGPNLGTPRAMGAFEYGDNLEVPIILPRIAKTIVKNMPSVYQLLPSQKLVDIYHEIYDGLNYETFFKDLTDGGGHVTNYEETQEYIRQNYNADMYNDAVEFRNYIENHQISSDINEFRFVGYGQTLPMLMIYLLQPKDPDNIILYGYDLKYRIIWGSGDGVVPIKSADGNREGHAKVYMYKLNHMKLLTEKTVINRIKDIILKDEIPPSSPVNSSEYKVSGHGVEIACPVDVKVYDNQGNVAEIDEDGFIVNEIDGLSYEIMEDAKHLFVPDDLEVTVELEGYDEGYMNLSFTHYDNDVPTGANALQHVKIHEGTFAEFTINGSDNASEIDITYDEFGDGNTEILNADVELNIGEMLDVTAPDTTAVMDGNEHNGWYTSDVEVRFDAVDIGESGEIVTLYSINDGPKEVFTEPFTVSEEGSSVIKYYSYDKAANYEGQQETTVNIDKTPPGRPEIVTGNSSWTHENVSFHILDGADDISGAWKSQYKIGNDGTWTDYTVPVTISNEGETVVYARTIDNAGHVSEITEEIVRIDKTAPSAPSIDAGTVDWTSSDVPVSILGGTDALSGVEKIEYRIGNNGNWVTYSDPFHISEEGETVISTRTVDRAGNVSDLSEITVRIDKSAPAAPVIEASTTDWTSENVTVTVTDGADALSGVEKSQYKIGESGTWLDYTDILTISEEGITTVYARTIDRVGHISHIAEISVKIDKSPPLPPELQISTTDWTNEDVTVTITDGPDHLSGAEKSQYKIGEDGNWTDYTGEVVIGEEGVTNVYARTLDRVGHVSEISHQVVRIDKTVPSSPVIEASTTEWTNENVTITVTDGTDALSGVEKSQYKIGEQGIWTDYTGTVTVGQEGEFNIYARSVDAAGNVSENVFVTVRIDKTAPSAPGNLTYISKSASGIYLSWLASTDNVAVKEYRIYVNSDLAETSQGLTFELNNVAPNALNVISVRAVDLAGNVSEHSNELKVMIADPIVRSAGYHSFAIKSDGTVWAWGENNRGQLGDGTGNERHLATENPYLENFRQIFPGITHNLGIDQDGTIWAWGDNHSGQLGNSSISNFADTPVQVVNFGPVLTASAGLSHSIALRNDRTVWTWGSNGQGQLGTGIGAFSHEPQRVPELEEVVAVSAGFDHSLALKSDGTVWSWGGNEFGQLGNGSYSSSNEPVQVANLDSVIRIVSGNYHNVALKSDGTVWTWGWNEGGQLGNGTYENQNIPVQVSGLDHVVDISASEGHTVALKSDGSVWAWGSNELGSLGDGTTVSRNVPTRVTHLNGATDVSTGDYSTLVSRQDGSVWAWGLNNHGQLGDTSTENRVTRVAVSGIPTEPDTEPPSPPSLLEATGVTSTTVVLSWEETTDNYGIKSYEIYKDNVWEGSVEVDGRSSGESTTYTVEGLASETTYQFAVRAKDYEGNLSDASQVINVTTESALPETTALGSNHSYMLKSDGTVWSWGDNYYGQLGDGTITTRYTPVQVQQLSSITDIKAGENHGIALKSDGTVWTWGSNQYGQIGDGTGLDRFTPVRVAGLSDIIAVGAGRFHSLALEADGTVWAWGYNYSGELGTGSTTLHSTPVQVQSLHNVVSIEAGDHHNLAVTQNGNVWAWGDNSYGQLGTGGTTAQTTPVQIAGLENISEVSAGGYHSLAVDESGELFAWGANAVGMLGDGTSTDRHVPVSVGSIHGVERIDAGFYHSLAAKDDGSAWSWGFNVYGQLGNGNTSNRLTPGAVTGLNDVTDIAAGGYHSAAVAGDGTVWTWGANTYGQLGDGSTSDSSVPVAVDTTNAAALSGSPIVTQEPPLETEKEKLDLDEQISQLPKITPVEEDVFAPSVPRHLRMEKQGDVVNLVWEASEDHYGVSEYRIYRNGEYFDSVQATEYAIRVEGMTGAGVFTVRAVDAAGNESRASRSVIVYGTGK